MSAGTPAVKWFTKLRSSPLMVSLLIVIFISCCTLIVRHLGWLQSLEFQAYDFFIRQQPKSTTSDPIVLVELTEADIHNASLDWPIYDDKMAAIFRNIEADQPAVIGLDIWRDMPVPKIGGAIQEFNQVLLTYSNIIAIFTRTNALKGIPGIAPPEVLKSNTDRIAYNDNLPIDDKVDQTIPKVRRTELFMNLPSGENFDALPFRVALIYLQRMGIEPKPDPADPKAFWLGKARLRPLQPNDGAYAGANMGGFQILLDFKRSDQFTRFSISDVLSGNIPPGTFRDKIVLLGVNAQSVFDE